MCKKVTHKGKLLFQFFYFGEILKMRELGPKTVFFFFFNPSINKPK